MQATACPVSAACFQPPIRRGGLCNYWIAVAIFASAIAFSPLFVGAVSATCPRLLALWHAQVLSAPYSSGRSLQPPPPARVRRREHLSAPYSSGRSLQPIGLPNGLNGTASFSPLFVGAVSATRFSFVVCLISSTTFSPLFVGAVSATSILHPSLTR